MLSSKPGPIGIFDSGYGGLTILHGIRQLLPEYDYLYLGDNARAPYGPRSFDVVYEFTRQAVVRLFEMGCHLVILGCNTASAKALRTIQQIDLPKIDPERRVLGVIRPTAEVIGSLTKSRHVGSRQLYGLLGYQYKRPVRELFATASISVQRSWSNATTDMQIVDGNYYYTLQELHSKNDRLSASATVSKGFYALKTKLSLGVNGSLGRGSQLSAGQWYDYTTQTLTLTPGIIVSPDWCEFDYEGSFSVNANKTTGHPRSSLFNWRQRLLMTTTVGNVDLSWKFVHYRNELQAGNTLNTLLSDAAVTWRLKKVRLKAQLQNIFDKQAYEETIYTGVATSTTSYLLRPRELILSVQFSL